MFNDSKILTFYSYKGGVGRSMALANLACLLAKRYKVIVIDWDLEAPGLHKFFNIPKEEIEYGLIDLFNDYKDLLRKTEIPTDGKLIDIEKYMKKVSEKYLKEVSEDFLGSIYILPAGKINNNYAANVNNFNWNDFYDNWNGYGFIEYLKNQLKEMADFILVDSRTGVTDIGGICTLQVPDAVVLLFSLNKQNILGTEMICEKIIKSAESMKKEIPKLFLVPSRVEKYVELDLLNDWIGEAAEHLEKYLNNCAGKQTAKDYLINYSIPYLGYYSFGEVIAIKKNTNNDLTKSYQNLMELILNNLDSSESGEQKEDEIRQPNVEYKPNIQKPENSLELVEDLLIKNPMEIGRAHV